MELADHRQTNSGQKHFECIVCNKRFTRTQHVVRHGRIHEGEEEREPYKCYMCDKTFRHSLNLLHHLRAHTGEKRYQCSQCDKHFRDSSNLRQHKRRADHATILPDVKMEAHNDMTKLGTGKLILETDHLDGKVVEKSYSCAECNKRFSYLRGLQKHMNVHTDKYRCPDCGKCCQSGIDLVNHRRTHSGEKPFECRVCSRQFARSHHLAVHSRTHSGEKVYKTFRRTADLDHHMRVHMGEKPYLCELCGRSFTSSSHLRQHQWFVHFFRMPSEVKTEADSAHHTKQPEDDKKTGENLIFMQ